MSYKQLTPEQFAQYRLNPNGMDANLRKWAQVPENRYYSVSVWPENLEGRVFVVANIFRSVKVEKISKSNQPTHQV